MHAMTTKRLAAAFASGLIVAGLATAGARPAGAAEEEKPKPPATLEEALVGGKPLVDLRYRYEHVDQGGTAEDAAANTVRARLGYQTGEFEGISALFELETVKHLGAEDFNDTINGKTRFPVVADPNSTDVNQLYLAYTGVPNTRAVGGRQRVVWHNLRFIGDVGFRQNQQTYDGISLTNTTLPNTTLSYLYVAQANRVFGEDSSVGTFNTDDHSFYGDYKFSDALTATGYGHFFDIDDSGNTLSSRTLGTRFAGKPALDMGLSFPYAAEYAWQTDYADNPADFSLSYFLVEPGVSYDGASGTFGYEVLGGNGTSAVQTPFATLHAFQGWADQFLTTPANGIRDLYGSLKYALAGVGLLDGLAFQGVYHDFDADHTNAHYGDEFDFLIGKTWYTYFTTSVIYANYGADQFATDTEKVWVQLDITY